MVQAKILAGAAGYALLVIVLLRPGLAEAQVTWETLTSFKSPRRMVVVDDTLYAATSGGLLLISDFDSPGREFVHMDGLGTTDLHDIAVDADGAIWLAGLGRLIRFDPMASKQYLFFDRDNNYLALYGIADDNDHLWIGAQIGLVLFSKTVDGGQIEDSYALFGTLNPSPVVYDVALVRDTIWIATSSGLASAPASNPLLLKSPLTWTTFDVIRYPELGTDTIRAVESYNDEIYIATSRGAFRFEPSSSDTSFVPIAFSQGRVVTDMEVEGDSLFVYHSAGLGVVTAGGAVSLPTTGLRRAPTTGVGWEGQRWVAMGDSGIFTWGGTEYIEYPHTGAPGNDVRTVAHSPQGILTAGFGTKVFAQYDGEHWVPRQMNARDGTMDILIDPEGDAWAATWGEGLWRLAPDTNINYDERNSACVGIASAPTYVVVRGLATDGVNIFASLFQAGNGDVVAYVPWDRADDPSAWGSFGAADGIANDLITAVGYGRGQMTLGTMSAGVYVCDLGSDPYQGTSLTSRNYTDDNSRLVSNSIRTIAYAPNGEVWIGTNLGISRWDSGIERLADVVLPEGVGTDVSSIVFDGRGNAWIGTRGGLMRLDATGGEPQIFTTRNSDLVSDDISDLWLDRGQGDVYVATSSGISVLHQQLDVLTTSLDSVVAAPNPFVIRSSDDRLTFNYDRPATVSIFTVAGERLAEFPINEPWDGRNERGEAIASGAYIYLITDESGETRRGKILLVRQK